MKSTCVVSVAGVLFMAAQPYHYCHGTPEEAQSAETENVEKEFSLSEEASDYLDRLEFRSFIQLSEKRLFGLHDPLENESLILEPGMALRGIEVVDFDPEGRLLTLSYGGITRELSLAASNILDLEEAEEPGIEEIRRRWSEREKERQAFNQRWEEAVNRSAEFAELQEHLQELFTELGGLRTALEKGTGDPRVRERIGRVGEEFRLLEEYSRAMISSDSGFEPEDLETFDLLRYQVRHSWPEVKEEF